jgi:hypothetical protein
VNAVLLMVGPVPPAAVLAYVKVARASLEALNDDPRLSATLTPDLLARFESLHDEWEQLAASSKETFCWERELDVEEAEWIILGFFRVLEVIEADGGPPQPLRDEVAAFYTPMVTSFLDAIERQGETPGAFAANLRLSWPYLSTS